MTRSKGLARWIQDAVDEGATTVEEIHKSIADLPLKVLEQSDIFKEPTKQVRRVQDRTIGAVYDLIREINEKVGELAADVLARAPARARHATGVTAHPRATSHTSRH